VLEDRLDLGTEQQGPGQDGVVQRLDADPIARQEQLAAPAVPDRQGEHPFESMQEVRPLLLVEVQQRLGVGARPVTVSFGFQFPAQDCMVVDLAVVGDPDRPVLVAHRLVAGGRQVDD